MIKKIDFDSNFKKTFLAFVNRYFLEPDIHDACSCLCEKYSLNQNLIFFSCWLASQQYRCLTQRDFTIISNKINSWHHKIIDNLKILNQSMAEKKRDDRFKEINALLVETEDFAERIEQVLIFELTQLLEKQKQPKANAANRAITNIFNYINSQRASIHKNDLEKVYRIVKKCFTE